MSAAVIDADRILDLLGDAIRKAPVLLDLLQTLLLHGVPSRVRPRRILGDLDTGRKVQVSVPALGRVPYMHL